MHYSYKPQRSKCDKRVRESRTSSLLYHLSYDVGEGKAEKYNRVYASRYSKISNHIPSMEKYISINKRIYDDKNSKEQKKIGMSHLLLQIKN